MLEFNTTKLEIKFNNQFYQIKFPTFKEMQDYAKVYNERDDKLLVIAEFIVKLGLPQEICDQLEMQHLEQIVEALTKPKK